ncbi:MAG: hypothetical protein KUA37_06635 [Desulfomicrobium sp.]|nr:hypothetical protein [Pseudomonadota bacterium]MBV1711668.1 hypothetical protein [Desulfomicrobium sp.]MBU4569732.1 hypothetical protein [Pseudomonadota bacterium]MBU4595452.1 hypothetical protein [Pseudomonadota bacterium]MBV1718743.1 hypothetical protein [Desulfomicrobium sp.]
MVGTQAADRANRIAVLIDRNVRQAVKLRAYFCRGAYSGHDVRTRFDQSKAAPGFNTILDSLYFEFVLTMARLYDNPDDQRMAEKTASIPVLFALLSAPETRAELQRRSVERKTPKDLRDQHGQPAPKEFVAELQKDAVRAAEAETNEIEALNTEYGTLKGSHLICRIRKARNEFLAHTALDPSRNNLADYGNAEELLGKTIPLVTRLQLAVRSCHTSLASESTIWEEHADIFWRALCCGTNMEPTTCRTTTTCPADGLN